MENKKKQSERMKRYYRTKNGLLTNIYSNQKSNSKLAGRKVPLYSKKELGEWLFNQINFETLFNNWINDNYSKNSCPSIDRIDNKKCYTIDNIQLMTWGENYKKGRIECSNDVRGKNHYKYKPKEYYAFKTTTRNAFKRICKTQNWNASEFEEILSDEKSGGCKKYYYKTIEDKK